MALAKAAPYTPYVNSPGRNKSSEDAFTSAAQTFYPSLTAPAAAPGTGANTTSPTTPSAPGVVDYTTLLANDPILGQTLAGNKAQGIQNLAQLNAQRQRALIGFGRVPTAEGAAVGDLSGVIDPTTAALATQNTRAGTSTVAQLLKAYQQKQESDTANLAARGILRSGAYNQHSTENLGGYNIASSQATGQLLDYLTGLYQGYLQQQQQLTGVGTQATNDAMARIIAQIQAGTLGAGGSTSSPATETPASVAAGIPDRRVSPGRSVAV